MSKTKEAILDAVEAYRDKGQGDIANFLLDLYMEPDPSVGNIVQLLEDAIKNKHDEVWTALYHREELLEHLEGMITAINIDRGVYDMTYLEDDYDVNSD